MKRRQRVAFKQDAQRRKRKPKPSRSGEAMTANTPKPPRLLTDDEYKNLLLALAEIELRSRSLRLYVASTRINVEAPVLLDYGVMSNAVALLAQAGMRATEIVDATVS